MTERSINGSRLSESKTENRIMTETNQFMQIADKLIGAMAFEEKQFKETGGFGNQKFVEKYNIIDGKLGQNDQDISKFRLQGNKLERKTHQTDKILSSVRKSTEILSQNHIQREKQRDKELQQKLQQLNQKSTARIREIREAEERQKDIDVQKIVGVKRDFNGDLQPLSQIQSPMPFDGISKHSRNDSLNQQNTVFQQTVQKILDVNDPKKFESNDKQYFNKPLADSKSTSDLPSIHYEKVNRSQNHSLYQKTIPSQPNELTNSTILPGAQKTINQMNTSSVNWGSKVNRTREDVSFLKEHSLPNIRHVTKVPLPFDKNTYGLLMSTSQITSGDSARDEYFQVVLGLRSIGRSIIDMPRNLEDLKRLSKQYDKNIAADDQIQDEKIYLSYIEDHYLAQRKRETETGDVDARQNSPIRDLQEFYNKMFHKLNINEGNISQRSRLRKHQTSSLVNIKEMTASELMNLEKSPPTINTNRKKMMLMDNTIMNQFGEEAFRVSVQGNHNVQKQKSPQNQSPKKTERLHLTKEEQCSLISARGDQRYASKTRDASKSKLLKSLSDREDLLVKPSIKTDGDSNKNNFPSWMLSNKSCDLPQLNLSKDLGKPSARQDAILLAKWFHDIMEVIEQESISSASKKYKMQEQNRGRLFTNQKVSEEEINQFDTFHFVQIAHNIAIKEITRQISVQCIERGVLLKSIFDSYIRLIDLIYSESLNMRRVLAKNFAVIFEKQVKMHENAIDKEKKLTDTRSYEIAQLKLQLLQAEKREQGLRSTNKKVTKLAVRNQLFFEEEQKKSVAFERQVRYLEDKIGKLQDNLDPSRYDHMQKELRRALNKIQKETILNHQPIKTQLIPGTYETQGQITVDDNFELKNEDIIRESNHSTDMEGFELYLELFNGFSRQTTVAVEAIADISDKGLSAIDLKEYGLLHDKANDVPDEMWRKMTRIKIRRPKSAKPKQIIGVLEESSDEIVSDNTSTYTQLQFNEVHFSATFNAYIPIKQMIMPVLKKRSLSAGNFNDNQLIQKKMNKLNRQKMAKLDQKISQDPMMKLKNTLGTALLKEIMENEANLYKLMIDHAFKKKDLTLALCKEVLQDFKGTIQASAAKKNTKNASKNSSQGKKLGTVRNSKASEILNFGQLENKNQMAAYQDQVQQNQKYSDVRNQLQMPSIAERFKTPDSENLFEGGILEDAQILSGQRSTFPKKSVGKTKDIAVQKKSSKEKEKVVKETKFQEWNFQKREKKEVVQKIREHPANAFTQKVLKKKDKILATELMPIKTLTRFINVIYAQFNAELLGNNNKRHLETKGNQSNSPEASANNFQVSVKKQNIKKDQSPEDEQNNKIQFGLRPTVQRVQSSLDIQKTKHEKFHSIQADKSQRSASNDQQPFVEPKSFEPTLIEWVHDFLHHKYGLKNVADKKFSALILSCIKYKDKLPRIQMFGRFLQLYDSFDCKDLKLYLDVQDAMLKLVLNYSIQESDEVTIVPLNRAFDYFKMVFHQRLTATSLNHCLNQLKLKAVQLVQEDQKLLHLKNAKEGISLDLLAEQVINTTNSLQAEKIKNIEDLFHAADLSATGIINFEEFKTLYKLIVIKVADSAESQLQEIKKIFNEYAEIHDDEEEGIRPQRGINHAAFERLCFEKDFFTIRAQNNFINMQQKNYLNVTEPQDAFSNVFNNLKENLDQIYAKLQTAVFEMNEGVSGLDKKRYLEMIEQMAKCIMYPVNQKIAFLTYKIVVETIRRAVIKNQIDNYMPVSTSSIKNFKQTLLDGGTIRTHKVNSILSKLGTSLINNPISSKLKRNDSSSAGFQSPIDPEEAAKYEKIKTVMQNLQKIGNIKKDPSNEYHSVDEISNLVSLHDIQKIDLNVAPHLQEKASFDSFQQESQDQIELNITEVDHSQTTQ